MNKHSLLLAGSMAILSACVLRGQIKADDFRIGEIAIGESSADFSLFTESTCRAGPDGLSDCSARDSLGVLYTFFGGAISRISVSADEASDELHLPAQIRFGEPVEVAADKIQSRYGISLLCAESAGVLVCASDLNIRSATGVLFGMELIGDETGGLAQVVLRTDF